MPRRTKKTLKKTNEVDVSALLISAVTEGDSESVKKLVLSHGLSCCECERGGYLLLCVAIKLGHIEIAEFLLQKGAKADCETDNVTTPLHLAMRQRFAGLVKLLLEKNVAVNAGNNKNETPLHLAAKGGYAEVVEVLLNNSASLTAQTNEGATPLFLAAEARHETVVEMLLKHACVNLKDLAKTRNSTLLNHVLLCNPRICVKVTKLVVCIVTEDDGHSKIVDELVNHGFHLSQEYVNESLLMAAVSKNYIKLIDSILKNRANCNVTKHYPQLLHEAVKVGRVEIAELFLKSGFNANASDGEGKTSLSHSLSCGESVRYVENIRLLLAYDADITKAPDLLHEAVTKGLIEVCKVLIENGADVNKLDTNGTTPLFLAVEKSSNTQEQELEGRNQIDETTRHKIIELLLNGSADVNINVLGYTAFHQAVLSGRKGAVSVFLKFGVDVDACAEDGSTPLSLAVENGDTEIVEILCENNADVNAGQDETSPLCMAARELKPEVVKMLLKFGAAINFDIADTVIDNRDWDNEDSDDYEDHDVFLDTKDSLFEHVLKLKVAGFHVRKQCYNYDYFYDEIQERCTKELNQLKTKELKQRNDDDGDDDDDDDEDDDDGYYREFQEKCTEEFNQLNTEKLNLPSTWHDVLVNNKNLGYNKNKLLMRKLKSLKWDEFPYYKDVIRSNLRKNNFRLELLQSGQNWLDFLVKTSNKLNGKKYSVLPVEILEQIVLYLSNSEIKSLISCGKALKCQLSHQ